MAPPASSTIAENVYAVTQSSPGRYRALSVDRRRFTEEHRIEPSRDPSALVFSSNGALVEGTELLVLDEAGAPLPEGQVGELALRGRYRFSGYFRRDDLTARAMTEGGWYKTGDLGFVHEGEVFVTGQKDYIVLKGRNYYPTDIEEVVGRVEGIAPGRVVAFGLPNEESGTEKLILLAEAKEGSTEHEKKLALKVRAAVSLEMDCTPGDVRIVPSRSLMGTRPLASWRAGTTGTATCSPWRGRRAPEPMFDTLPFYAAVLVAALISAGLPKERVRARALLLSLVSLGILRAVAEVAVEAAPLPGGGRRLGYGRRLAGPQGERGAPLHHLRAAVRAHRGALVRRQAGARRRLAAPVHLRRLLVLLRQGLDLNQGRARPARRAPRAARGAGLLACSSPPTWPGRCTCSTSSTRRCASPSLRTRRAWSTRCSGSRSASSR